MATSLAEIRSLDDLREYRIPFGEQKQYTYTFSNEDFNSRRFERVREERSTQGDWGEYHVAPLHEFSMWGVLGNTPFLYYAGRDQEVLHLKRGNSREEIFIVPAHPPIDVVVVNGKPYTLQDELYRVYLSWLTTLNVESVRKLAEHMKERFTIKEIDDALIPFIFHNFTHPKYVPLVPD